VEGKEAPTHFEHDKGKEKQRKPFGYY